MVLSILISLKTFNAFFENYVDLFEALKIASKNNVAIDIYVGAMKVDEKTTKFLAEFTKAPVIHLLKMHSKMVIVDKSVLALGSCNWLENYTYAKDLKNESVVFQPGTVAPLIHMIYETVGNYETLAKTAENYKGQTTPDAKNARKKASDEITAIFVARPRLSIKMACDSDVELLSTPQEHRQYFLNLLADAKKSLIICSPFITPKEDKLKVKIPLGLIDKFLKSGGKIQIYYCNMEDGETKQDAKPKKEESNLQRFQKYFGKFIDDNKFKLTEVPHLHQKTVIADNTYTVGSYNWLSSSDTLDQYCLSEMTISIKGPWATKLIEDFTASFPHGR